VSLIQNQNNQKRRPGKRHHQRVRKFNKQQYTAEKRQAGQQPRLSFPKNIQIAKDKNRQRQSKIAARIKGVKSSETKDRNNNNGKNDNCIHQVSLYFSNI
jgi:hypothetical protein